MENIANLILAIGLIVIWGSLGVSMLITSIQGIIYDKRREKRDQEYHKERMKGLNSISKE